MATAVSCFSSPLPHSLFPPRLKLATHPFHASIYRSISTRWTRARSGGPEENDTGKKRGSPLSPDDLSYLGKLATGSIGSAAAIKYGSVIFPEITRPNIVQALLMISVPVLVAVLVLIKESGSESKHKDLL